MPASAWRPNSRSLFHTSGRSSSRPSSTRGSCAGGGSQRSRCVQGRAARQRVKAARQRVGGYQAPGWPQAKGSALGLLGGSSAPLAGLFRAQDLGEAAGSGFVRRSQTPNLGALSARGMPGRPSGSHRSRRGPLDTPLGEAAHSRCSRSAIQGPCMGILLRAVRMWQQACAFHVTRYGRGRRYVSSAAVSADVPAGMRGSIQAVQMFEH
jgi:hypothetical protein